MQREVFMKKITISFFIVLILAGINCLGAQTRSELQEMYVEFLTSEGYRPTVDAKGDVLFTTQGQGFYINVMENDLQSFHIVLSKFLDVVVASNRQKALESASAAIRTTRLARVYITSNSKIAVDAYTFIGDPNDFKLVLNRMVNVIITARNNFLSEMRKRP